ncbi:MAG: rhodanese-like domain-containing protein [Psychrilyobacter sp.]|uniref:rhodanese-like domain-containing protein n=1 Tax=Psychrilyobacter sp. TaxID=2586924 RepID=UPI003C72610C
MFKILGLRFGKKGKAFDISKDEALKLLESDNTIVLDVRTPKEIIAVPSLVEDAITIDYEDKNFENEIKKLDRNKTYLAVCTRGNYARGACITMKKNGFKSIKSLKGGLNAFNSCST